MKKLLIAAAIAGLMGTAHAQSAFEGFYGQVGIGYEGVTPGFSDGNLKSLTTTTVKIDGGKSNSFAGGIGLGYYFPVDKTLLLGVGVDASLIPGQKITSTTTLSTGSVSSTKGNKQYSYSVFVSPAVVIDKDKLAYAKFGYSGLSNAEEGANPKYYNGFAFGIGYRQMISNGLYGFIEGNYATHTKKEISPLSTNTSAPSVMNVLVGVGYKF